MRLRGSREPAWPGVVAALSIGAAVGFLIRRGCTGVSLKKDLSSLLTKDEIDKSSGFEAFARWTDLPDVSQFVTEDALTVFAQKSELPDLSPYALKSDVPGLSRGAVLPEMSSLARTEQVREALDQKDREIADLRERLARERAERAEALSRLEARLETLLTRS